MSMHNILLDSLYNNGFWILTFFMSGRGPGAQRTTRLTSVQEIPGSHPGWLGGVVFNLKTYNILFLLLFNKVSAFLLEHQG